MGAVRVGQRGEAPMQAAAASGLGLACSVGLSVHRCCAPTTRKDVCLPSVLVVAPGTPSALVGRHLLGEALTVEMCAQPDAVLQAAPKYAPDLLVLSEMNVDEQHSFALAIQEERRWRLVPILYVLDGKAPGFAIPGSFRPEIDGIARGPIDSADVRRRIRELAREGTSGAELVIVGPYQLDPLRGRLRLGEIEVPLTEREAEIMAALLARPNRTVTAGEIIERSWGVSADNRHLQILRRHISNIRRKLDATPAARNVCTVRGLGYRFDVRHAANVGHAPRAVHRSMPARVEVPG